MFPAGPLPSIFGLHIATYLISDLAGRPIVNPLPVRFRKRLYEKLFKELSKREMRLAGVREGLKLPFTENDAGFVLEDLHRGRSILPPHNIPARPTLVRWRPDEGVSLKNLVVMEKEDADKHEADVLLWSGLPGQGLSLSVFEYFILILSGSHDGTGKCRAATGGGVGK